MQTAIRPAELADLAAVEHIVGQAYSPYVPRIGKPPGPMLDDYRQRITAGTLWIADRGGPAGLLVLLTQPDHLLLDNIAVAPAFQGQGVGRALLAFAEAEAHRQGYAELRLYTHELMTENIALYATLGWAETGRGEQDGYRRVFFRKPVG